MFNRPNLNLRTSFAELEKRSKSPNINMRRQDKLLKPPQKIKESIEQRNIKSQMTVRRSKNFIEPLYIDDNVSQVKFKRTGMKVVKSRRDSFELLPPSMRDDHFDPQAEYDEKASRYFVDRPLFATQVENSRAQTP